MKIEALIEVVWDLIGPRSVDMATKHETELRDFLSRIPVEIRRIEDLCVKGPENFLADLKPIERLRLIARIRQRIETWDTGVTQRSRQKSQIIKSEILLKYKPLIEEAKNERKKILYCVLAYAENRDITDNTITIKNTELHDFQSNFYGAEMSTVMRHIRLIKEANTDLCKKVSKWYSYNLQILRAELDKA